MKTILTTLACTLLLAACNKPAPTDTVESLLANPARLKEVHAQCKADHDKVGTPCATRRVRPRGGASWAAARHTRQRHRLHPLLHRKTES